ncbi:MAG: choice-of-anchor D domain-containing protein [Verrucomicrobiales bacterium]|nr:choice-of-anchor D domain-containing protein [Verrucomicrobiales bacterium]
MKINRSISLLRWYSGPSMAVLVALLAGVTAGAQPTPAIPNPSFEADTFTVWPGHASANGGVISGWTLTGATIGLNPAGGNPFADNGSVPHGRNVAFIQARGTLRTTITGLVPGWKYRVTFRANRRALTGEPQPVWSLNDGALTPFTASPAVGGLNPYHQVSGDFIATGVLADLRVQNNNSADSALLVDDFTITPLFPRMTVESPAGTPLRSRISEWSLRDPGQTTEPGELSRVKGIAAGSAHTVALRQNGTVVAWGENVAGRTSVPAGLSGVTAIAAGREHTVALKQDGTVVAWGAGPGGGLPAGLSGVTAIAAGHSHNVALKRDGTVVAWGGGIDGLQFVPWGLSGVTAIAAGGRHTVALRQDGTIVAWGWNSSGQTSVPPELSGVTAISAGEGHSLALTRHGTGIAWGRNNMGQASVPDGLSGVTAIAAGEGHSLALKEDGTVVAWGRNHEGQTSVPAGLNDVTAIAAGYFHSVALKQDGTVRVWGEGSQLAPVPTGLGGVAAISAGGAHTLALTRDDTVAAWGWGTAGQMNVPPGLTGVKAVAAGGLHSLALRHDGTVIAWGRNDEGQTDVPAGLGDVTAIAAGMLYSLALKSDGTVVAWGWDRARPASVPLGLRGVTTIAAGWEHAVVLQQKADFGRLPLGHPPVPVEFTVRNTGSGILRLGGVTLSGEHAADFRLDLAGMTNVVNSPPGTHWTGFGVTFTPGGPGPRWTTLSVRSNDPDQGLLIIALTGEGRGPVMAVSGNDADIADGATTPAPANHTDLGGSLAGSDVVVRTYRIRNLGNEPLELIGTPAVVLGGVNAGDFAVTPPPVSQVPPRGSTLLQVTFTPGAAGLRRATVSIPSNDPLASPFSFAIQGRGFSAAVDTDGDGMNDWVEYQLSALGFDWQTPQREMVTDYWAQSPTNGLYHQAQYDASRELGRAEVITNPNPHGLYTLAQVHALNAGTPLLARDPASGQFTLTLGLERSADLTNFQPFPLTAPQTVINADGRLEFRFTAPDDAAFFRLLAE